MGRTKLAFLSDLACFAWIALLTWQTRLVAAGQVARALKEYRKHKRPIY